MLRLRWIHVFSIALVAPILGACASGGVTTGEEFKEEMDLPPYEGPKATIAVGPCQDKSGGSANFAVGEGDEQIQYSFTSEVGQGMADMFVTGLLNTDRFRVLETGALEALEQEQDLEGEEAQGQMGGADLLVTCAVTSVEPNAGGAGGAIVNTALGVLGGGGGGIKQAEVELDIRLVDVKTREILTAFAANGTATDAAVVGIFAGGSTATGLGGYSNTPIEGAVKKAILKATEHLAVNTPKEYFGAAQQKETAAQ